MCSFGLVTILPKLGILRIVLVHALCQTISYSQRSAVAKVDLMMTKITSKNNNFEKLTKIKENE